MFEMISNFFNPIKQYTTLILIGVILTVVVTGYLHYNSIINQLSVAKANEEKYKLVIDNQTDMINKALSTIDEWKEAQKRFNDTIKEMNRVNASANMTLRRLNEKFAAHDLAELSIKHPLLITDIINRASNDALRLLRCESGAEDADCAVRLSKARNNTTTAEPITH